MLYDRRPARMHPGSASKQDPAKADAVFDARAAGLRPHFGRLQPVDPAAASVA